MTARPVCYGDARDQKFSKVLGGGSYGAVYEYCETPQDCTAAAKLQNNDVKAIAEGMKQSYPSYTADELLQAAQERIKAQRQEYNTQVILYNNFPAIIAQPIRFEVCPKGPYSLTLLTKYETGDFATTSQGYYIGLEAQLPPIYQKRTQTLLMARDHVNQMFKIAQTLDENHIIHGDIKPDNFLVTADANLVLTDFGLSGSFDPERLKEGFSLPSAIAGWSLNVGCNVLARSKRKDWQFYRYYNVWQLELSLYFQTYPVLLCDISAKGNGVEVIPDSVEPFSGSPIDIPRAYRQQYELYCPFHF